MTIVISDLTNATAVQLHWARYHAVGVVVPVMLPQKTKQKLGWISPFIRRTLRSSDYSDEIIERAGTLCFQRCINQGAKI